MLLYRACEHHRYARRNVRESCPELRRPLVEVACPLNDDSMPQACPSAALLSVEPYLVMIEPLTISFSKVIMHLKREVPSQGELWPLSDISGSPSDQKVIGGCTGGSAMFTHMLHLAVSCTSSNSVQSASCGAGPLQPAAAGGGGNAGVRGARGRERRRGLAGVRALRAAGLAGGAAPLRPVRAGHLLRPGAVLLLVLVHLMRRPCLCA